ncbi:hypothetical protein, partial [Microbacterium esteraromaticum]|uniref:hypothetical protein n=1 Tax=Microbacterium esteraromaticum TaxID=57043 RepID=UPI000B352C02
MSAGAKGATVALAVVGGLVLIGTGASAAFAGVSQIGEKPADAEVSVVGVQGVDAEVSGAQLNIGFYDGDTAMLRADDGTLQGWKLRRDGNDLEVSSPHRGFDWWGLGWGGFGWNGDDDQQVTLLLPQSLAGLDADLELNAGILTADGDFGQIDADVSAGALTLNGSGKSLDLTLTAGRADVELARVEKASYEVTAGRVTSTLTEKVPRAVKIEVSA